MAPNNSTKYNLEKFDESIDFSLWRMKMHVVLIQQGLLKVLKGKQGLPDTMSPDEKEDTLERADSAMLAQLHEQQCFIFDIDSDTTKLWHIRLGHMSERNMDVLSKQGYANGVKGYQLWCPDSKSSRFLISRDVTFDESSLLSKKKELIDAGKYHGVREKVELEVRASDSLHIMPIDKDDGSHSTEANEKPQEQQYTIAKNRLRREIRPPQKYGYADMVAYALSVVEGIEVQP
ncbi:hypothetical protein RJ639_023445 [Escallonia herrerae]|uniref:Retroviral polymerase SH3-like domain-containing protein n=1 Tax=Escallonia herrerae TaxID=1293975 RepID=A0AA89AET5_9ASTE|nr:hypothetical protein RJ639_023445 [Escallonia herrerae]